MVGWTPWDWLNQPTADCKFTFRVKLMRMLTADFAIAVGSMLFSLITIIAEAEYANSFAVCGENKTADYCEDTNSCVKCSEISTFSKYELITMLSIAKRFFYSTVVFPGVFLGMLLMSPAWRWDQGDTLKDWYELEEYWHAGTLPLKLSKAFVFKSLFFLLTSSAFFAGIGIAVYKFLVFRTILYPAILFNITLFDSFPKSMAKYASSSDRGRQNERDTARWAATRKQIEAFELMHVKISVLQKVFAPTSQLLVIAEQEAIEYQYIPGTGNCLESTSDAESARRAGRGRVSPVEEYDLDK
jgi:hypothetical protein